MSSVAASRPLDESTGQLYAQALVAVARANGEIGGDEGARLTERIIARTGAAIPLEDLLLAETLTSVHLAELVRDGAGPFRSGGSHPGELASMIVTDAIVVVLAKGYVAEEEAHLIVRFATALGCTLDDVRQMSTHLWPWFAANVR